MAYTVLFICTGNICRSPMAEGLFRDSVKKHSSDFVVKSAGVGAQNDLPPSENSVRAMGDIDIDITEQRSQMVTAELVKEANIIVGMTQGHADMVNLMFPEAAEKIFILGEFDHSIPIHEREIADPIGGSYEVYAHCRDQIKEGIVPLLNSINQNNSMASGQSNQATSEIVFGSDHGGYKLKEILIKHLEDKGINCSDYGCNSDGRTDYPDFAQSVSEAITKTEGQLGILICTTGIGMSIAANKVSGVRAALVTDEATAISARQHNNANIICLGSSNTDEDAAKLIVDQFIKTQFETGGRHEQRVSKIEHSEINNLKLSKVDPEILEVINNETARQQENIELIASENFTSPAVMFTQGSTLTNKYAEGYPAKRWYGGCEHVDVAEELAIERAKKLFGAEHANVQPHSGSGANMAVYFSTLKPGDKILTMDLSHGGHLTHGNKANFSGRFYEVVHYGVNPESELIDYDKLAKVAAEEKPDMITVGASAYPRSIDFERMGQIARDVGALLLADIAHIAGLVATGQHASPVQHADFVTTTTHKTLRGPRGGLILCGEENAKKIDSQTFPGIQGGPLMHVIAAKAVCFKEALQPEFKLYQTQVVANAEALATGLTNNGFRLVSGGTDNHLMLVDVGSRDMTGKECQTALDEAGITVNKNTIPFETRSPFQASGIRIGTPAVSTRGMKELEMAEIADMISEVLLDLKNIDKRNLVRQRVLQLTARFPLPY